MTRIANRITVLALAIFTTFGTSHGQANDHGALEAATRSIVADDLHEIAAVLADDTLAGREAGSDGGHVASGYIARRLARLKLRPAGDDARTYYQSFGAGYRNVLAMLEGTDPDLKQQVILIGAHFDHVGLGTRRNSYGPLGYIHNGADDNASGTAAVLEIAEAFTRLPQPPARSVLFAFWDGEEQGLLGSKHWLEFPTVPRDRIKLCVNLDMVGRLRNDRLEVYGAHTGSDLHRRIVEQNAASPLKLFFTWELKANSDHYPFFERQIPVLMFHTGLHEDYHRPTDDVELLNVKGMERVTRLTFRVVESLAGDADVPEFRATASSESAETDAALGQEAGPPPPRLGVSWEPARPDANGVIVTQVTSGSAAERAGILPGDTLIRLGGILITGDRQLRRLVDVSPEETKVELVRDGKSFTRALRLEGKPRWLGIRMRRDPANPSTRVICHITPDSPAAAAGLQNGDRLYSVNGKRMNSGPWWVVTAPDDRHRCRCVVERDGQLLTLDATEASRE